MSYIKRNDNFTNGRFYIVDAATGKNRGSVVIDPYDAPNNHCGECPVFLADAEGGAECDACICNEAAEDAHNGLIRGLIEANEDIAEARKLLTRSLEMIYILGYDSSFTNPAIDTLTTDIKKFLEETK